MADQDGGRYLMENDGELDDDDFRRVYLAKAQDGDPGLDDDTFDYLQQNWDRLEPEQRQQVADQLTGDQKDQLRKEYGTLQGANGRREYAPDNEGLDEDAFDAAYSNWEELDTDQRSRQWQQMNGAQKQKIRSEYHRMDESPEDWMIDAEDWNQKSGDEKDQAWYDGGLDRKERRAIARSQEYELDDIEMDPSRYEDEGWHSITKPEKLAVIESDEYTVEDFGKRDYRPRSTGGSLLGLMTGTGAGSVAAPFTFQMMTSGNAELAATGAGIQAVAGIGGYAAGSLADEVSRDTSRRHAFSDQDLREAYQQRQQTEEDPAEDGTERDWDYVSKVRDSLLGSDEDDVEQADRTET